MFKITLGRPKEDRPYELDTVEVEVPALPRVGDYVGHEPSGIVGYVQNVTFYWNEDNEPLHIEVRLR